MGVAEKAIHHYKLARKEAGSNDIVRAQALQTHLSKCSEARKLRDRQTVLKETQSGVSTDADSAPQISFPQVMLEKISPIELDSLLHYLML